MAEFGDLLFSLVNYARFINIDPEEALERTNKKFIKRFQYLRNGICKRRKKNGRDDAGRNGCVLGASEESLEFKSFEFKVSSL